MNFKNVKTQSIDVGRTEFFYRRLGENNRGIPVIFLNHLSDPGIMDGMAFKHQIQKLFQKCAWVRMISEPIDIDKIKICFVPRRIKAR